MNRARKIDFNELEVRIGLIANLQNPSLVERENLWNVSVASYHEEILDGHKSGYIKKELAALLWQRVPALGKSQNAIFRQLYRKIDCLAERGNLADKRREGANKKRAPLLSKEDRAALVQQSVFECGGSLDFAWQNCLQKKSLSEALLKRYQPRKDRRPRCSSNIRRQIQTELDELKEFHVRPHWHGNNIAPMTRDWSNVYAQDIYECDDKTLDVLCRVTVEENEREIRCQFLPLIDSKSGKILEFVLIGEANYNSAAIRTLIKKACLKYGLPKKFLFERGLWKNAKLLGNNAGSKPFMDVENFATRCGVELRHALPGRARTKIVETVFRLLDRKMYGWPGYIGNDEMHRKFERARHNGLWTFDELLENITSAVEDYNNTKSQSTVKGGYFTPNEVWENCRRKNDQGEVEPVAKLPHEFEYLLAEHCEEAVVREAGIKFTAGEKYHYFSPELVDMLAGWRGQAVKVWFDPEHPEIATVTDLKGEKFLPVNRVPNAPSDLTTPEGRQMFADASAPYRAQMRQVRQRYSDLKATYTPPFRVTMADPVARVKAQARKQARTIGERQNLASQSASLETAEDKALRRAAQRELVEAFDRNNQHLLV